MDTTQRKTRKDQTPVSPKARHQRVSAHDDKAPTVKTPGYTTGYLRGYHDGYQDGCAAGWEASHGRHEKDDEIWHRVRKLKVDRRRELGQKLAAAMQSNTTTEKQIAALNREEALLALADDHAYWTTQVR
jgi:hypothetical protein